MEAAQHSETTVAIYHRTKRHIPRDWHLHEHCCQKLNCCADESKVYLQVTGRGRKMCKWICVSTAKSTVLTN